jgi:uncharacterized protein with von Willebrand factor type A (vWA) domain
MAVTTGSQQLLEFIKFLRGRDVPISPADSMDAVHAASLLGYADRSALRDGLAAVLAKSPFEESRYHEAFEIFFGLPESRSPENQIPPQEGSEDPADQPPSDDQSSANQQQSPQQQSSALEQAANASEALTQLMASPLLRALQNGDEASLAVAIEAAARDAGVEGIRLFTQRGQFTRRLLDALGETVLRDAAIDLESHNRAAFEELQALREQLRLRARDRVERAYLIHASGDTEEFLDNTLAEVKLANISPHQMVRMRKLIERMARKLATRHGRRRKRHRRGQLHVPATLRASIATDGIPFTTRWKTVTKRRPEVMAICDVSGSVAAYAKFLLMFLYAVQDVLPRTRSFAFSSTLGEVTDWFEELPVEEAVTAVNRTYGGATDYARAFQDFADLALGEIHSATTVIILGDARNNNSDPRLDLLAEIKSRCKRLIWLNPEPRVAWGSGDSAMLPVIHHCHLATECNNLKQLERIVDKLLADSRR